MNTEQEWKQQFEAELGSAEAARTAGNEGKARVCARRAAGKVIAYYFSQQGKPLPGSSAYDHLRYLKENPEVPERLREVAAHFLVRTNPDYTLPIQVDLIQEARWLANQLLAENE